MIIFLFPSEYVALTITGLIHFIHYATASLALRVRIASVSGQSRGYDIQQFAELPVC